MNSQIVLTAIAQFRATHNNEVPALVVINGNNIECLTYAQVVQRSEMNDANRLCDEYLVFVVNYSLPDYYKDNFAVMIENQNFMKTTIKDYLFYLLEAETRA